VDVPFSRERERERERERKVPYLKTLRAIQRLKFILNIAHTKDVLKENEVTDHQHSSTKEYRIMCIFRAVPRVEFERSSGIMSLTRHRIRQ